jgi:hypothetical protein
MSRNCDMGTAAFLSSNGTGPSTAAYVQLIVSLALVVAWWQIFTKAGRRGWYAIVPFFNVYQAMKVARAPKWFFWTGLIAVPALWYAVVTEFLTILGFPSGTASEVRTAQTEVELWWYLGIALVTVLAAIYFITMVYLAKAFGKTELFGFGLILLPWIFLFVLAFSSNIRYEDDIEAQRLQKGYVLINGIPIRLDQLSTTPGPSPYPTPPTYSPPTEQAIQSPRTQTPQPPAHPPTQPSPLPVDVEASLWDQIDDGDTYFPFPTPSSSVSESTPAPQPAPTQAPQPTSPQPSAEPDHAYPPVPHEPVSPTAQIQASTAPGWYNVANDPDQRAWWDGEGWSNHQRRDGSQWLSV